MGKATIFKPKLDRKNEHQRSGDAMSDDIDPGNGTMAL
jgi:hypothetical protein